MGTASFYYSPEASGGIKDKVYNRKKPLKKSPIISLHLKIVSLMFKSSIFALWKQIDRKK
jgi:hypothetical protein